MELFQLAKRQEKKIAHAVEQLKKQHGGSARLDDMQFTLPKITVKYEKSRPDDLSEADTKRYDEALSVRKDENGNIDEVGCNEGLRNFIYSALLFAHNPVRLKQDSAGHEEVKLVQTRGKPEEQHLRFDILRPGYYEPAKVFAEIDKLEILMFAGWRKETPFSDNMKKTFATEQECKRAEFLLRSMAQALGETKEDIDDAFKTAPNPNAIVIDQEFLSMLVRAERTTEADYGRELH